MARVRKIIEPILQKYEKLQLTKSPLYLQLKEDTQNSMWIKEVSSVLESVENAKYIFSISKEITPQKNDQKVLEMFSEIDGARWLVKGAIDGKYDKIEYLRKGSQSKSPDFVAYRGIDKFPVEIKMLSPQDLDERKFLSRVISKVKDEALLQLNAYRTRCKFARGTILFWSHEPIRLEKISYDQMRTTINSKIPKQPFPLSIYVTIYAYGLWDFHL